MHQRLNQILLAVVMILALSGAVRAGTPPAEGAVTLRLYQGATAYVHNPAGIAFQAALDVREWNLLENGPREVLFKVYDPDGRVLERRVVEDDGIAGRPFLPETGGWDHEMWYYALCYGRGSVPMLRWSAFSEPARVAALAKRTFTCAVPAGKKGVYRVLVVGSRDHVVTLRLPSSLRFALAGHPVWLHAHGDLLKRSYLYVPKGTTAVHVGFAEFDQPVTRSFTLTAPDGTRLWEGPATGGFRDANVRLDPPGKYDDQVLTLEASPGTGDFLAHVQFSRTDVRPYRGTGGVPALFAPDEATARALRGGAIYYEDQVFWHPYQVRFHKWLKSLKPEEFVIHDAAGKEIAPTEGKRWGFGARSYVYRGLPERPGYLPLNGPHEPPPLCDTLMHSYPAHRQRAVLNVALRDLAAGLRTITVGDVPVVGQWNGNLAYAFATYGWHYWRPAWRILRQSDAPPEVKEIVREAMILCGDRLAFARGIERTNGNALAHIPMALRYAAEATQDPMQEKLARTYLERFATEGWGRGTGISRSGDCQEHFAHDFAYGGYITNTYAAIAADLGDPRFQAIRDRVTELYTYLYCADTVAAPWGSRTAQGTSLGRTGWKGEPGPDFTVSVNGGNEWFAARRPTYYALTFHGRLAPEWLDNYFATRIGYGGGMLCQLTVPGKGTVIASSAAGNYGAGMQRENWPAFHIHSVVGTLADGRALVAADSEHLNAQLEGDTVSGSGEVRDRPIHVARSYTFGADRIACRVELSDTSLRAIYWGKGPSSQVAEAYEMIPFVSKAGAAATTVRALDAGGRPGADLAAEPAEAAGVVIDRGGYGVRVLFDKPRPVKRGKSNTVLIQLAGQATPAAGIGFAYEIIPYVGE